MVHHRKADVAGEEVARALYASRSFPDHLARYPFLDATGFRRHLLLPLAQLENESEVVEEHHAVCQLGLLFRDYWELTGRKREGAHEYVRVLLGVEIVKEAGRVFRALVHSRTVRIVSVVVPRPTEAPLRRDR